MSEVLTSHSAVGRTGTRSKVVRREAAARLLGGVIFYALLALILLAAIPYGTVTPGWEAVFECTCFGLGLLWIAEAALSRSLKLRGIVMLPPLFGIVALAFLQTLSIGGAHPVSADPFETGRFIYKVLALIIAGELLLAYTTDRRRLSLLIHAVIFAALASALFGIVRQLTQGQGTDGFLLPGLEPSTGFGQFINRNHFALFMEMALGLIAGFMLAGGVRGELVLTYALLALPLWLALILSNSRGGILGLFCLLLFLVFSYGSISARTIRKEGSDKLVRRVLSSFSIRILLAVCLTLSVAAGALWVGGDRLTGRLNSSLAGVSDVQTNENADRAEIWKATWRLVKDHPLAGVGFGGYWSAIPQYHQASGSLIPFQAHNDYLELLASGGPVAVLLAGWFVVAVLTRLRATLRSGDTFRRAAAFGAAAALFTVAVHSTVDFGLHVTSNALVFVSLLVVGTADMSPVSGAAENQAAAKL